MSTENKEFTYTYKAPTEAERREINDIRRQYETHSEAEGDLARLRRLDRHVKNGATAPSLVLGVIGLLVFGLGLTMVLEWQLIGWGVTVSVLGALTMLPAYPLSRFLEKRARKKHGAEILRLSDKLLCEGEKTE